jgi:hypothetical protein
VPDEVFGDPFVPPVSDGSGHDRVLLRKASALLQQAGFVIKDGTAVIAASFPQIGLGLLGVSLAFGLKSENAARSVLD